MNSWKAFQSSVTAVAGQAASTVGGAVGSVDLSTAGTKLSKNFQNLNQSIKERTGTVEDLTELPQEYLDLERRVDGLRSAHLSLLKVAKCYEGQTYDYPIALQESAMELGGTIAHSVSFWAAAATKEFGKGADAKWRDQLGTNLPQPQVAEKPAEVHKTLPHALSRAAASGAVETGPSRLSNVLKTYAVAEDKIGSHRIAHDEAISKNFLQPWSATLNSSLQAAIKSRQNVKSARISLDASRGVLKNATGGPKQEQARMEVEAAEEKLVNATEEAINLMRSVLENPEPIKNISALVKAQQAFYAQAAEQLAAIEAEIDEAGVQAEADYRKTLH